MANADILKFIMEISPSLISFGKSLFEEFSGNSDEAIKNIEDLRDAIEKNRSHRDDQLREKHQI